MSSMGSFAICLPPLLDPKSEEKLVEYGMKRGDYSNTFESRAVPNPILAAARALEDLYWYAKDEDIPLPNKLIVNVHEDR